LPPPSLVLDQSQAEIYKADELRPFVPIAVKKKIPGARGAFLQCVGSQIGRRLTALRQTCRGEGF